MINAMTDKKSDFDSSSSDDDQFNNGKKESFSEKVLRQNSSRQLRVDSQK